jgi:hypothetical protein
MRKPFQVFDPKEEHSLLEIPDLFGSVGEGNRNKSGSA